MYPEGDTDSLLRITPGPIRLERVL